MYVAHLTLHDFRSYADRRRRARAGRRPRSSAATGRARPTSSRRSTTSPGSASHRVATDAPLVRAGADQAVVRAAVVRTGARRCSRSRSTRAGPTGPGSTGRRCPGPASWSAWCARWSSRPRTSTLVKGDPSERRRFLDDLLVLRTPRLAGVRADYDRVLKQRNSLLKTAGAARRGLGAREARAVDARRSGTTTSPGTGAELLAARLALVDDLRPYVGKAYETVARGATRDDAEIDVQAVLRARRRRRPRPR